VEIALWRHAETRGNVERRYIGSTDEPLSERGRLHAALSGAVPFVPVVYCSPMIRAVQTATIKFPHSRLICLPGLREMDFGAFEGRTADEMERDLDYRDWVDGNCEGQTPNGESKSSFCARTCVAFSEIIAENLRMQRNYVAIVAHGGTIMSVFERFARPHRDYYDYHVPNCGGFKALLDDESWSRDPQLYNIQRL
jgi:alpha-ribazole phosphatase